MFSRLAAVVAAALLVIFSQPVCADVIQSSDIVPLDNSVVGSGNNTMSLGMFQFSGGEVNNAVPGFNGDNGNNTLPNGGGADTGFFDESYLTTAGELQDFYRLNFSDGMGGSTVSEIAIFLNLNETGQIPSATNLLNRLDVVVNASTINGNPDPFGDLTGAEQALIDQIFTGGSLEASLASSVNLPVVAQGAGQADYVIFTGINPFDLDANDTVLFNISMSNLNNGGEQLFLSGEIAPQDLQMIPEPTGALLMVGMLLTGVVRNRRGRSI